MYLFFGFHGRIGRLQWWLGQFVCLVCLVMTFMALVVVVGPSVMDANHFESLSDTHRTDLEATITMFKLAGCIPVIWVTVATSVKRFHDRDKSGLWFLIALVPYIGGLWLLIECGLLSGTSGDNSYGKRDSGGRERSRKYGDQQRPNMIGRRKQQTDIPSSESRRNSDFKNQRPVFGKRGS